MLHRHPHRCPQPPGPAVAQGNLAAVRAGNVEGDRKAEPGAARPGGKPVRLLRLRLTPSARLELSVHLNDITQFARPPIQSHKRDSP